MYVGRFEGIEESVHALGGGRLGGRSWGAVAWLRSWEALVSHLPPDPSFPLLISYHLLIHLNISIMTDRAKHTPPPTPSTQPPWMMTPPRSAEKLMRALSIDPVTLDDIPTTTADDDSDYFTYLQQITSPTYRDPPLLSAPPRQKPLFLDDDEDDDIQMGTDNRMVGLT
jgi:hypothetical protein